jgi:hypothetical protein
VFEAFVLATLVRPTAPVAETVKSEDANEATPVTLLLACGMFATPPDELKVSRFPTMETVTFVPPVRVRFPVMPLREIT